MNRAAIVIVVIVAVVLAAIPIGRHESWRIRVAAQTAPPTTDGTATSDWSAAGPDTHPSRVTLTHPEDR